MEKTTSDHAPMTRDFVDATGRSWVAVAIDHTVAHGKRGAQLAFRPAGDEDGEPLRSSVTFNSQEAAAFALRTLGEKELRRRLTLAQAEAGTV
jgi:hypothetical protein